MGYTSTVAYKIRFEDSGRFNAFIVEAKLDPNTQKCFEEENTKWANFEVDEGLLEVRVFAENVRWYTEYPDVKCHINLLGKAAMHNELSIEDTDEEVCWYLFRRVGEEEDDIECEFDGDCDWDCLQLSRQLIVDWK